MRKATIPTSRIATPQRPTVADSGCELFAACTARTREALEVCRDGADMNAAQLDRNSFTRSTSGAAQNIISRVGRATQRWVSVETNNLKSMMMEIVFAHAHWRPGAARFRRRHRRYNLEIAQEMKVCCNGCEIHIDAQLKVSRIALNCEVETAMNARIDVSVACVNT